MTSKLVSRPYALYSVLVMHLFLCKREGDNWPEVSTDTLQYSVSLYSASTYSNMIVYITKACVQKSDYLFVEEKILEQVLIHDLDNF